ncbi:uncharacterized protein LOC125940803 isoform X2 [Dermacentor silvarum]|uniref:uncharacterized protein LOC125940803 isoform X2 n=1 Tax=Dermacentor silvarum TaxID=543639 RepID=UPI0021012CE6|nr:uncharacterized protein LOC125940803 isoform X2 [Dermacentor silvarum]
MGRRCYVPHCRSGESACDERVSMFKVPSDPSRLEAWRRAIPAGGKRTLLRPGHTVCEKHFRAEQVSRAYYSELNGRVLLNALKKRAVLSPGAVPSIFPCLPKHCAREEKGAKPAQKKNAPHRRPKSSVAAKPAILKNSEATSAAPCIKIVREEPDVSLKTEPDNAGTSTFHKPYIDAAEVTKRDGRDSPPTVTRHRCSKTSPVPQVSAISRLSEATNRASFLRTAWKAPDMPVRLERDDTGNGESATHKPCSNASELPSSSWEKNTALTVAHKYSCPRKPALAARSSTVMFNVGHSEAVGSCASSTQLGQEEPYLVFAVDLNENCNGTTTSHGFHSDTAEADGTSKLHCSAVPLGETDCSMLDCCPCDERLLRFSLLLSRALTLLLPSKSWAIHIVEDFSPEAVVISEVVMPVDRLRPPFHRKVLEFTATSDDSISLRSFIHSRTVSLKSIASGNMPFHSLSEVEDVIEDFHKLHVCLGGPSLEMYNGNMQSAYVDQCGRWRHDCCTLVTEEGSCSACQNLNCVLDISDSKKE